MIINTGGFLAATALLAAILLVWAQLWVNTYRLYKERLNKDKGEKPKTEYEKRKSDIESGISLGLTWIFSAIGFSVAALVCFAYFEFVADIAWVQEFGMGFFVASLSMTAVHILQSYMSAFFKFIKDKDFDNPTFSLGKRFQGKHARATLIFGSAIIFLAFSLFGAFWCSQWWIGNLVAFGLALILFIYLGIKK